MKNSTIFKIHKKIKKLSILITLLFLSFGTMIPNFVYATETTSGIQMSFNGENTIYPDKSPVLSIHIQSDKKIDNTSVKASIDGQIIDFTFQYKGHTEFDLVNEDEYWVVDSELEGTVTSRNLYLKDGSHTLSVTATDTSGVPVHKEWNFNVKSLPYFLDPSPSIGEETKYNKGFTIRALDNDGINASNIKFYFDNTLVPISYLNGIITYSPTSNISDGLHTVKIDVQDNAGNLSTFISNFKVCATGPTLTFDKEGETFTYPTQMLSVDIDSNINLNSNDYTVKLNGNVLNAYFSYPIGKEENYDWVVEDYTVGKLVFTTPRLKDGVQTLEVTARDHLGNSTTKSWNFYANIAPVFGISTPQNGSYTKDNTGFNLKVNDDTSINPDSIIAKLDGEIVPVTFDSETGIVSYKIEEGCCDCNCDCEKCNPQLINDGHHVVNITVGDTAGNNSTYSFDYTIVTSGPTLNFLQKDQKLNSIPELTVNLESQALLSKDNYTFKLDGQIVSAEFIYKGHWIDLSQYEEPDEWAIDSYKEGKIVYAPSNLSDGVHTVEVTAMDSAGNQSTQTSNFTFEMKPEFSNATPTNGTETLNKTGFSVMVFDYNDGIQDSSSFKVKLNGVLVNAQYNQTSKILSYYPEGGLQDGDYTVNIEVTDKAGTKSEITWSFKVNTSSPIILFNNNGNTFSSLPTLTFKLQSLQDISQSGFTLQMDGNLINASNYQIVFPGHYEYDYDEEYGEYYNEHYVIDSYKQASVYYRPSSLIAGNHSLILSAKDVSGNTTTINGTFTNTNTQNLEITSPSINANLNYYASIRATTSLSKLNVSIKNNSTNEVLDLGEQLPINGIATWSWNTRSVINGEYTIILTGYDVVGKYIRTERIVTVAN